MKSGIAPRLRIASSCAAGKGMKLQLTPPLWHSAKAEKDSSSEGGFFAKASKLAIAVGLIGAGWAVVPGSIQAPQRAKSSGGTGGSGGSMSLSNARGGGALLAVAAAGASGAGGPAGSR